MRQCIDLTQFVKCHQDSINLIRDDLIHSRPVVCRNRTLLYFTIKSYSPFQERAVSRYEQATSGKLEDYQRKTPRQKYSAHPKYREYREDIWVRTLLVLRLLTFNSSNFRVSLTRALCPQSLDLFLEVCTSHHSDSYVALKSDPSIQNGAMEMTKTAIWK